VTYGGAPSAPKGGTIMRKGISTYLVRFISPWSARQHYRRARLHQAGRPRSARTGFPGNCASGLELDLDRLEELTPSNPSAL